MRTLILYHSKYGQTRKIAYWIAAELEAARHEVEVVDIEQIDKSFLVTPFDSVVVGSPLYAGKHSKLLANFINDHRTQLANKLTAFFSVSLSAAGDEIQKEDAVRCMDKFLSACQWSPTIKATFAGNLAYREYSWLTRLMMRWIAGRAGGDTDTSKNFEYTDWASVSQFSKWLVSCESESEIVTSHSISP